MAADAGSASSLCSAAMACSPLSFRFHKTAAIGTVGESSEAGIRERSHWAPGGHRGCREIRFGRHCGVCCLIVFVYCPFVRSGNREITPGSSDRKLSF